YVAPPSFPVSISSYNTAIFFLSCDPDLLHLPSFPTRRSSDLELLQEALLSVQYTFVLLKFPYPLCLCSLQEPSHRRVLTYQGTLDRKSTRLNSSHVSISYAVFCLKKKSHRKTK